VKWRINADTSPRANARERSENRLKEDRSFDGIEIRRGMESDANALHELLDSLKDEGEVWGSMVRAMRDKEEEWIRNHIEHDRVHDKENAYQFVFFAFDGDKMVGHVNGKVYNTRLLERATPHIRQHIEDYDRKINLEGETTGGVGIAVHKDYRQKGVGEMLMRKAIQEAKKLGATVLFTMCVLIPETAPKIRFSEKLGFKEHIRFRKGDRLGMHSLAEDHVFMKLDLQ